MELEEWIAGRIIENLDNRGSDNRGSTVLRICRNSLEKYFTGSKFTDNSLILMRSQIFVVVLILNIF